MPMPFDATMKELIRNHPADWLGHLGRPITGPPEILSIERSTISASADTLIRVGDRVIQVS